MPPGSRTRYREQYRRCGKANCRRCAEGPGHGPYWYEIWREDGRLHTRYIGKVLPAEAAPPVEAVLPEPLSAAAPAAPTVSLPPEQPALDLRAIAPPAAPIEPAPYMGLRVLLLGQFHLEVNGRVVADWRRQSAATLLKLLLIADQRRMRREAVMVILSPRADAEAARAALATAVHALRHTLEPSLGPGATPRYLVQEGELLSLRLGPDDFVDLHVFEQALDEADRMDDPLEALETASSLYLGDLLPDETGEWCIGPREALRLRRHGVLLRLQEARTRHGRHDGALAALQALLAADPTQEEAALRMMRLLARHGRRAEALRVYDRVKHALRREVKALPSAELEALARVLRAGDTPPRPSRFKASAEPRPTPVSDPRRALSHLVGREKELTRVRAAMHAAREGRGGMVILVGEAGIGKTRLAEESADAALMFGFTVLWGRCGEGERDLPYAPIAEALRAYCLARPAKALKRELSGAEAVLAIVPELRGMVGLVPPGPLGNAGAERLRLWSAVRALLESAGRSRPIALILDDLHWADDATLGLLTFLARRGGEPRVFILGAARDDISDNHPLRAMMLEGDRAGGITTVAVPSLSPLQVGELAGRVLGSPLSDQRAAVLHAQCNGNPFFVTELLALLAARRAEAGIPGDLVDAAVLEQEEALPGTVRQTLGRRLDRLSMATRVLLRAGAVLGLRFGIDVVAALAGQERITCEDALDEAVAAGLLREDVDAAGGGYVLVHSLLRRTLYEELLPGQRRRLHERAGAELAARHEQRGSPSAETIAHHFVRTNEHAKAAHWLEQAGNHAAAVHAPSLAIQYYTQACARLAAAGVDPDDRINPARLHERLGDLQLLEGEYHAARENYSLARGYAASPNRQAELWLKEGATWEKRSEYDRALASFDQATAAATLAGSADDPTRQGLVAEIAIRRGGVHYQRSDYPAAAEAARFALGILGEDREDVGVARAHNLYGRIACSRGEYDDADARHRKALAIFELHGDLVGAAGSWNSLGAVAWYRSDYEQAEECYRQTLDLKERLGDQDGIALALGNLGLMAASRGDIAEAENRHRRALAIQERSGNMHAAAHSLESLGLMAYQRSDLSAADAYYERALPLLEQVPDPFGIAHIQHSLALLTLDQGNFAAAERWSRASMAIHMELRFPTGIQSGWVNLGLIAWARGDFPRANAFLRRGLRVGERAGYEPTIATALLHLGGLVGERGDYPQAIRLLRRAHRLIVRLGGVEEGLLTVLECVRVHGRAGMTRRARRLFNAAERAVKLRGVGPAQLALLLTGAELELVLGNDAEALSAAEEGLALARARGQGREVGRALILVGRAHGLAGRPDQGESCLREAMAHLDALGSMVEAARAWFALAGLLAAGQAIIPAEARTLAIAAQAVFAAQKAEADLEECRSFLLFHPRRMQWEEHLSYSTGTGEPTL